MTSPRTKFYLDKAEDPAKMIRMIILEMEETLVEVRASAARTIADQKGMRRQIGKLDRLQDSWVEKAELALSKDREDLAKAALFEKQKAADMAGELKAEIDVLDDALRSAEADIAEGHADSLSLGAPPKTLDDEIAELRNSDKVDAELEALKASLAKRSNGGEAAKQGE